MIFFWRGLFLARDAYRDVGGRATQDAKADGLRRKMLLHFRHFRHPWRSCGEAHDYMDTGRLQGCNR